VTVPSEMVQSSAPRGGVTPSRVAVAQILTALRDGDLLDLAFDRETRALDARDRRWVQELTYGLLRKRAWLDALLTERVRGGLVRLDPDLCDLLRSGAYQLLQMRSVPPYAAIGQTVELAKGRHGVGASKLANAVLRRLDRERDTLTPVPPTDAIDALALEHSHPRWLVQRWALRFGATEAAALLTANNTEPGTYARPYGVSADALLAALPPGTGYVNPEALVADSVKLTLGVPLTELPAFTQGLFFVQDPAATLVTMYAALEPGSVVADLCAAPGGKALEYARQAGLVIAADRSVNRLGRVTSNIARLDARNVAPLAMDALQPALREVDAVVLDAPCTGTGTFRRHPDARWRLKPSDLAVTATAQRALLQQAAKLVRPGGLLIYSTCSLELEENDQPVEVFLATHPEFTLEPPPEGTVPASVMDHGFLRVLPQRHGTDGAFAARLRRAPNAS
jgi:16S rRNA (cytosine967-C5)-methyltransferase